MMWSRGVKRFDELFTTGSVAITAAFVECVKSQAGLGVIAKTKANILFIL